MVTLSTINRLINVLERNITQINPTLDYNRIAQAFILLGKLCDEYEGDTEDWTHLGNYTCDSLIVGAYWHYTDWHSGQFSDSYGALCSLGNIFNPNMSTGPEEESTESDIYDMLNDMAVNYYDRN